MPGLPCANWWTKSSEIKPCSERILLHLHTGKLGEPSIQILLDNIPHAAGLGLVDCLRLHLLAAGTEAARRIHTLLKSITLPAKDVIGVLAVAGIVTVAEVEGLGAVGGPLLLVVEGGGVPDNLVHQLWDADRVASWAVASDVQERGGAASRVGDVALVVGAVKILSVPACGELDVGANTTLAWLGWQSLSINSIILARSGGISTKVGTGVATVAVVSLHCSINGTSRWVTDEHSESRLEGGDLAGLGGYIVYKNTTSDLCAEVIIELPRSTQLLHTLVATVAGLEVQVGGPVVGEVV